MQTLSRLTVVGLTMLWILAVVPQVPLLGPFLLLSEAVRSFPELIIGSWVLGFAFSAFLWSKSVKQAIFLIVVLVASSPFYVFPLWPFLTPRSEEPPLQGQTTLVSIAIVNVEFGLASSQRLREVLPQQLPDVLVVSEVTEKWIAGADFASDYEFKLEAPGSTAEGMAVYSRFPLEDVKRLTPGFFNTLAMNLIISANTPVHLVALHAPPPQGDPVFHLRKAYFEAIEQHIQSIPPNLPLVLAGDFNTTPLSDTYKRFISQKKLRNVAHGRGLPPTWPLPIFPWIGAYIDQVVFRGLLEGTDLQLLESFGSDHLPLIVTLSAAVAPFSPTGSHQSPSELH